MYLLIYLFFLLEIIYILYSAYLTYYLMKLSTSIIFSKSALVFALLTSSTNFFKV